MWVVENLNKLKNNPFLFDNHLRPQYQFIDKSVEIFKFEEGLENIILKLKKKLNITINDSLEKINTSNKEPFEWTLEALTLVNEIYKNDFEYFSYDMKKLKITIDA